MKQYSHAKSYDEIVAERQEKKIQNNYKKLFAIFSAATLLAHGGLAIFLALVWTKWFFFGFFETEIPTTQMGLLVGAYLFMRLARMVIPK